MIYTLIIIGLLWGIAAFCNAVMDVLAFKFKSSVFKDKDEDWWNPAKSWRNKYKNKMVSNGPKFPGSTTVFSFVTDAWHLFQFLSNSFLALSVVVGIHSFNNLTLLQLLIAFIALKMIWGVIFEMFYGYLLRK